MMKAERVLLILALAVLLFSATGLTAEPVRLSVLYFDNITDNPDLGWLEKGLADMLITDLSLSKDITGIEREELEKIIREQAENRRETA